jgi:hypothetical protein
MQASNHLGFMLQLLAARTTERYDVDFSKNGRSVDEIVEVFVAFCHCMKEEALECFIRGVFRKFEVSFIKIAMEKSIMPDVHQNMDISSEEAMICETGLNINTSRILFKHYTNFGQR